MVVVTYAISPVHWSSRKKSMFTSIQYYKLNSTTAGTRRPNRNPFQTQRIAFYHYCQSTKTIEKDGGLMYSRITRSRCFEILFNIQRIIHTTRILRCYQCCLPKWKPLVFSFENFVSSCLCEHRVVGWVIYYKKAFDAALKCMFYVHCENDSLCAMCFVVNNHIVSIVSIVYNVQLLKRGCCFFLFWYAWNVERCNAPEIWNTISLRWAFSSLEAGFFHKNSFPPSSNDFTLRLISYGKLHRHPISHQTNNKLYREMGKISNNNQFPNVIVGQ